MFHRTTGLLCPGCGSLRALHQLLHGHLAAAFRFNGLLVISLPFVAWFLGRFTLSKIKHQRMPSVKPAGLWAGLLILVVFGLLRNLPLTGVPWMTPWAP
jgi:hypothetical protein